MVPAAVLSTTTWTGNPELVCEDVRDWDAVDDGDCEGVIESDAVTLGVELVLAVAVDESELLGESDGELDADDDWLGVTEGVRVRLGV